MQKRSINKLRLKKSTIATFEKVNGGLNSPIKRAQSVENTTCMSLSACDTDQQQ